jgi:hypothetical protein
MGARKTDEPGALFEASQSFTSEWIREHGGNDFAGGVCREGTLVRAGHPILEAHPEQFIPARADVGDRKPV